MLPDEPMDGMERRPLTWPGPVGGCSLVTMIALGSWVEWQRSRTGAWDAWFVAPLLCGFLLAFAATAYEGRHHKWLVRGAAYLLVLPPVALFALTAAAHAAA